MTRDNASETSRAELRAALDESVRLNAATPGPRWRMTPKLRQSMNRHWLARLVISAWGGHIPVIALLVPESLMGRALAQVGAMGVVMMLALLVLALCGLMDSAINDILPKRFTTTLMYHRHIGFMAMAIVLVLVGGTIAIKSGAPAVLASFLIPAGFCVWVTAADLYSRHKGLRA
ncbi:MAG: hypothetical protein H7255_14615 [Ramlibacter sp.]|nr:hypothetical protein [Ramlibacter sp.]